MFVQGATPGRVDGWSYHEEDEDFTKGAFIPPARILRLNILFQRRYGTRHLGSRPAQATASQRYDEQGTGCPASRTSGSFLPTPSGPRYNRALVPAALESICYFRAIYGI